MKSQFKFCFPDLFLLISFVLVGGFNEYMACFFSVALSVYLLIKIKKQAQISWKKSLLSLSFMLIPLFYGITTLWAVDNGMAFIGFMKFLPIALYTLSLWQAEDTRIPDILPFFAALLTVVSAIAMQIKPLTDIFSVSGRLSGTFSYPNSFALFLLVSELLLIQKKHLKLPDYITLAILSAGILYTGSRTALIAFVLFNIAYILICGNKRLRIALGILLGAVVLIIAVSVIIWGENSIFYRFITISLTSDTFVGRLLYAVDALPLLLKYPFGMGYMGYFYTQGSIQSGVYSLLYVHNDFLQLILDIGIIPAALLIIGLIKWFLKKDVTAGRKLTVGALCFHTLLDFNLQFTSVFMLLILLTDCGEARNFSLSRKKGIAASALAISCALSLYMGIALGTAQIGQRELSEKLYPFNTQNKLELLEKTEDINEANSLADEILRCNKQYYVPYSIKAKYFYSQGKFSLLIEYKRIALERYPLRYSEYTEYCQMLINGIAVYERNGDTASADLCKIELINTSKLFEESKKRVGTLGSMIENQPWAYLPDYITEYIESIE